MTAPTYISMAGASESRSLSNFSQFMGIIRFLLFDPYSLRPGEIKDLGKHTRELLRDAFWVWWALRYWRLAEVPEKCDLAADDSAASGRGRYDPGDLT